MKTIRQWQKEVHELAVSKGWWEGKPKDDRIIEAILMLHAEISELVEDIRVDNMEITFINEKPCGAPSELADIGIRLLDLCEAMGVDLHAMIEMKHNYNKSRPYRHGNKRL